MPRNLWTLLGVSEEAEITIARQKAEKWARKGGVTVVPTSRGGEEYLGLPGPESAPSAPPASQLDQIADMVAAKLGLPSGAQTAKGTKVSEVSLDVATEERLLPAVTSIPHGKRPTVSYRPPRSYRRAIEWIVEVTGESANTVHAEALKAGLSARLADLQAEGHAIPVEWIEAADAEGKG